MLRPHLLQSRASPSKQTLCSAPIAVSHRWSLGCASWALQCAGLLALGDRTAVLRYEVWMYYQSNHSTQIEIQDPIVPQSFKRLRSRQPLAQSTMLPLFKAEPAAYSFRCRYQTCSTWDTGMLAGPVQCCRWDFWACVWTCNNRYSVCLVHDERQTLMLAHGDAVGLTMTVVRSDLLGQSCAFNLLFRSSKTNLGQSMSS